MPKSVIKKVKKPSHPIKLCLTAGEKQTPCKWLVKKKRYVCHSGSLLCPLIRSQKFCRLYAIYILSQDDVKREVKWLQKQYAYARWSGEAFAQKSQKIGDIEQKKLDKAIKEELKCIGEIESLQKKARELTQYKLYGLRIRRSLAEGRVNMKKSLDKRVDESRKKAEQLQEKIKHKKSFIKKMHEGMEKLNAED